MSSLLHFSHAFNKTEQYLDDELISGAQQYVEAMKDDLDTAFDFHKNHDKKAHSLREALDDLEELMQEYTKKHAEYNRLADADEEEQEELDALAKDVKEAFEDAHAVYKEEMNFLEKEFELFQELQEDEKQLENLLG